MERWITPIILIFESSFISTSFGFSNEKPRFSFIENRVYRQSEPGLKPGFSVTLCEVLCTAVEQDRFCRCQSKNKRINGKKARFS